MNAARRSLGAVLLAAFAASGCGSSGSSVGSSVGIPDQPVDCTTLTDQCYFPFPTNLFTRRDATPTGLAIGIRAENFPSPVTERVLEVYPPTILDSHDGFSPLAPVMMPLPEPPDSASLPSSPAASAESRSSIRIWDLDRGEPVAFRSLVDDKALAQDPPHAVLSLIPEAPFRNRGTYLAVVTDRVRTGDGLPMPPFPGFARLLDSGPSASSDVERVRAAYQPVFDLMRASLGEDPTHVVLATVFTIQSDEPITRKMRALASAIEERAKRKPPTYRITQINPPIPAIETGGVEMGIVGRMTTPDFRGPDGLIVWDDHDRPVEQREHELEFLLKLPSGGTGHAPVVVFGHGLSVVKETMLEISGAVGKRGYATIGIDVGAHGSRIGEDGYITAYFKFERLLDTRDLFLQTIADQMQLVRLVQGALTSLDVQPGGQGDGVPDLAAAPIAFVGQSLGTVLGGTYLAIEPAIGAGVLNVPGGGFASLLQQSEGLNGLLDGFLPEGATPEDRLVLIPMAQMLVDDVDPANFGKHVIDQPFPGSRPKDVLIQESMDDGIMPNAATELLAGALGLPQVGTPLEEIFGLAQVPAPAEGSGLYQFRVSDNGFLNHGFLLSRPGALAQVVDFIDTRATNGIARISPE